MRHSSFPDESDEQAPDVTQGLLRYPCRRCAGGLFADFSDVVTPETGLTLHWPGRAPKRLWAFPDGLEHLVLGHARLEFCAPGETPALVRVQGRDFFLEPRPAAEQGSPAHAFALLAAADVLKAMAAFLAVEGRWDLTGCFHRAALFDPAQKTFLRQVEDIGRHNCIDRLAGWSLEAGEDLTSRALFVSARATASLVGKMVAAGFPAAVSRSAVTSAGVELALENGLTLVGFARENRFTVFVDPHGRILDPGRTTRQGQP